MPTFNSNEYLSLPQQVSKNKKDIASLDGRVTNVEAISAGNTTVKVLGSVTIPAYDSFATLDAVAQTNLAEILIANHSNYNREQLFALKINLTASLVDDSSEFPVVYGNVNYTMVFTMGARQLVDAGTDTYHYIAVATSIDKRFQLEFNFKHDDGTFTSIPAVIMNDIRPETPQVLSITFDPIPSRIDFQWAKDLGPNLDFEFEIFDFNTKVRLCSGEASIKYNGSTPSGYVIATGTQFVSIKLGKAKDTGTTYATPLGLTSTPWTGTKVIVKLHAKDNRQLTQTIINDYYMYETSTYIRGLNFGTADEAILNGDPAPSSNIADKRKVMIYVENEADSTNAPTVTIGGVEPKPGLTVKFRYTKMLYPASRISNLGYPKLYAFSWYTGVATNAVTIDVGTNIVFAYATSGEITTSFGSSSALPAFYNLKINSGSTCEFAIAKLTTAGATATLTIVSITNSVTNGAGTALTLTGVWAVS